MGLKKEHTLKYGDGSGLSWLVRMNVKARGGEFCRCHSAYHMRTVNAKTGEVIRRDCLKCDRPVQSNTGADQPREPKANEG